MRIETLQPEHYEQVLEIYNHEILHGIAHFGIEPLDIAEFTADCRRLEPSHPAVVALEGTTVLGFARSSTWKSRGGYRATCEVGAYVREEFQGRGIAKALYEEFLPAVQESGFHTALAGIALPNPASIALHEAFGFHYVGTLPEVGRKFEQWINVGYWARTFA